MDSQNHCVHSMLWVVWKRKLEEKEEFCLPFCRQKILSLRDQETNPGWFRELVKLSLKWVGLRVVFCDAAELLKLQVLQEKEIPWVRAGGPASQNPNSPLFWDWTPVPESCCDFECLQSSEDALWACANTTVPGQQGFGDGGGSCPASPHHCPGSALAPLQHSCLDFTLTSVKSPHINSEINSTVK